MTNILPCPFCGSADLTLTVDRFGWKVVQCDDCGTSGPCIDLEGQQYIERWNARTPQHVAPAQAERTYAQGVEDANQMVGALWSDLFNKGLVKASGADYFDKWRYRIKALVVPSTPSEPAQQQPGPLPLCPYCFGLGKIEALEVTSTNGNSPINIEGGA